MDKFNKLLKKFGEICKGLISTSLMFLCLGVIVQLLIDDTILGWDSYNGSLRPSIAFPDKKEEDFFIFFFG